MLENFFKALAHIETVIDKAAVLAKDMAPLAKALAPLAGSNAAAVVAGASAAEAIATATDKAIQDHQAAGNTTQSAVTSLATIARAVADSNVTSDSTAAKIHTIVNVLDPAMTGT